MSMRTSSAYSPSLRFEKRTFASTTPAFLTRTSSRVTVVSPNSPVTACSRMEVVNVVGTPIITFRPPEGVSFFGPVISRVPTDDEALELWDAVIKLATFPGFAEMKRSLRERPQLNILGGVSAAPVQEDWQHGHRRGHLTADRS